VDTRVRQRKVLGDLWSARFGVALSAIAVVLGSVWLRLEPAGQPDVWLVAVVLTLLVIGQATAPLGRARATEQTVLRALGAEDRAPIHFALVEGAALGALAGVVALVVGPSLGQALIWLGAAVATGALAALLVARRALHAQRP
jgi:predicted lysophospholipase L1 biosynthesis ABC-type transport system permease subunit